MWHLRPLTSAPAAIASTTGSRSRSNSFASSPTPRMCSGAGSASPRNGTARNVFEGRLNKGGSKVVELKSNQRSVRQIVFNCRSLAARHRQDHHRDDVHTRPSSCRSTSDRRGHRRDARRRHADRRPRRQCRRNSCSGCQARRDGAGRCIPLRTKDRTFNAVSQRILPGQSGRVVTRVTAAGTGRGRLGSLWPVSGWLWGDAEVAVLSPDASPPVPVQWPLIGRRWGLGRRLPAETRGPRTQARVRGPLRANAPPCRSIPCASCGSGS